MASSLVKSFIGSFGGIQRSLLVKPVGRQAVSLHDRRFSSSPVENEVRIVQLEGGNEGGCGTITLTTPLYMLLHTLQCRSVYFDL